MVLLGLSQRTTVDRRQFLEIATWRDGMIKMSKGFMDKADDFLTVLKRLNPPLTTQHLKSFYDAIHSERLITLNALEMFAKTVEELVALQTAFAQQESHILLYNPAP